MHVKAVFADPTTIYGSCSFLPNLGVGWCGRNVIVSSSRFATLGILALIAIVLAFILRINHDWRHVIFRAAKIQGIELHALNLDSANSMSLFLISSFI